MEARRSSAASDVSQLGVKMVEVRSMWNLLRISASFSRSASSFWLCARGSGSHVGRSERTLPAMLQAVDFVGVAPGGGGLPQEWASCVETYVCSQGWVALLPSRDGLDRGGASK